MPGGLSCTAPSSPSPTGNSGRGRLRIRNRWTSTARKPDLNRSLTTGPDTSPVIANTHTARNNPHVTLSDYTHLADMQVIVRHQDRGALRLDHLHDQALCEPEGRGDLLITHIMPLVVRSLKRWLASKARRLKSGTSASVARRPISGIGRVTSFARLSGRYVARSEAFGSRDRGAQSCHSR
jgi:hypothetical protein